MGQEQQLHWQLPGAGAAGAGGCPGAGQRGCGLGTHYVVPPLSAAIPASKTRPCAGHEHPVECYLGSTGWGWLQWHRLSPRAQLIPWQICHWKPLSSREGTKGEAPGCCRPAQSNALGSAKHSSPMEGVRKRRSPYPET